MKSYLIPVLTIFVIIGIGTIAYQRIEGWSMIDSAYFSTTTLATIGFGDVAPKTDAGKVFTICYIIGGVSVMLYELSQIGGLHQKHLEDRVKTGLDRIEKMMKR
jgi:hypothetical protein